MKFKGSEQKKFILAIIEVASAWFHLLLIRKKKIVEILISSIEAI